jgi:hypothetical protein
MKVNRELEQLSFPSCQNGEINSWLHLAVELKADVENIQNLPASRNCTSRHVRKRLISKKKQKKKKSKTHFVLSNVSDGIIKTLKVKMDSGRPDVV